MANALDAIRSGGKLIGYVRVSAADQNTVRQLDGIQLDKVFTDHASGKSTERPALEQMLSFVREDDTVVVHSMDRLARNVEDLLRLVRGLTGKGVTVKFVKEGLTFSANGTNPFDRLMLTILGAFAEFERSLILERQREGIAKAKERRVYKGKPLQLSPAQIKQLYADSDAGIPKTRIARSLGISRKNVYEYLQRRTVKEAA